MHSSIIYGAWQLNLGTSENPIRMVWIDVTLQGKMEMEEKEW